MAQKPAELNFTDEELRLRVHHVGGIGDVGPISRLKIFGDDIEWVAYDADEDSLSATAPPGQHYKLVHKCIGSTNAPGTFNVMREQSASSLYPAAPSAEKYTLVCVQGRPFIKEGKTLIWGEHARIVKEVPVEINTIDRLIENGNAPQIDFISMDAQGADFDILSGASKALSSSIVGVICEIEFAELYHGQALFCDIQDYLRQRGFRFCDFLSRQDFNTAPYPIELQGRGFFTVGEALFFKDVSALFDDERMQSDARQVVIQSLKLAVIATVFDHFDYALGILHALREKQLLCLDRLSSSTSLNYIKMLRDLVLAADAIQANAPLLTYAEGRYGFGEEIKTTGGPKEGPGKFKLYVYLMMRLLRMAIGRITKRNRPFYYASISKVFHAYGLSRVAKDHDRRLVMYLLGMSFPPRTRLSLYAGRLLHPFYL